MCSLKEQFGARIKELREKQGMSQEELAELVNMESRHISRIETGRSFTTIENIQNIADALNVDISMIFSFSHKKGREFIKNKISEYVDSASDEQLELFYKIASGIFK